jgi:hypothetical protein
MITSELSLCEAQKEAERARDVGWKVTAEESQIGVWLRAEAADGGKPLYARTKRDLAMLIVGGAVARRRL